MLPEVIRTVSRDAGGQPVQLVGWCLGGILALLAAADDPGLPIASVAAVAAPVDATAARLVPPCGEPGRHGQVRAAAPGTILTHLDNADFLAQIEAVDHFRHMMIAYPGHAVQRIYRSILDGGALLRGGVRIGGRTVDLGRIGVPVLAVAGRGDRFAPVPAVRPLLALLGGAPQVRFEIASGGHLGVLTGREARSTTWRHLDRWLDEGIVRHGIRAPAGRRPRLIRILAGFPHAKGRSNLLCGPAINTPAGVSSR